MPSERDAFLAALRENWNDETTHKIFADWLDENDEPELADLHRGWTLAKQEEAERFLAGFADDCETNVEIVLEAAGEHLDTGNYGTLRLGFDTPDIAWSSRREFWEAFQVATGRVVPEDRRESSFVSCSC